MHRSRNSITSSKAPRNSSWKKRLHIERQTPAQSQTRREVNVTVHKIRIEAETPAQTRRERDAAAHSRRVERQTLEPR
ncbi:hypothetical protein AVEN_179649-1 [Araneus ventricosus]|uniref:Uncharacterized protein n=1 Tax=Araneus ventricosus TaxID=182803 RepID=A0A4Y2PN57_ARAVE|nr:hypothetical protein AVEN_179649-1 [Araneus ventricosus]